MRNLKKIRIYLDTSVIGGCFDEEFRIASNSLVEEFISGKKVILISTALTDELELSPERVKNMLLKIPAQYSEHLSLNEEIKYLAGVYQSRSVVPKKSGMDALHIAFATYYKADILVSWNFKHIVNYQKIHQINAVNLELNYGQIEIRNPREVLDYEKI